MLQEISNQLINIEAKLSNDSFLTRKRNVFLAEGDTGSISRHSYLIPRNTSEPLIVLNQMIQSLALYMVDLNRLTTNFYNTKEVQLNSLIARLENIELKNKILRSLELGVEVFNLVMADKKLIKPASTYNIDQGGMTFNPIRTSEIVPASVQISRSSNIRIGHIDNPLLQSERDALFTADPNDIYSVHTIYNSPIKIMFDCKFSSKQVINQINFLHLNKPGQVVRLKIWNRGMSSSQYYDSLLWEGIVEESIIYLEKPIISEQMFLEIEASIPDPGYRNQLDMKKLAFVQQEYNTSIICETINLPALTNKFLTLEGYNLLHNDSKNLFNLSVKAEGTLLFPLSSGEKAAGPYRDPYLSIYLDIKSPKDIIKYLGELKYKQTPSIQEGFENKIFAKFATQSEVIIVQERDNSNEIFFPFPLENYESHINVMLNGQQCKRALLPDGLAGLSYYIEYTGSGYLVNFADNVCSLGSKVSFDIKNTYSYIKNNKLFLEDLGLATEYAVNFAKEIKTKRIAAIALESRMIPVQVKNLQKVSFYTLDNSLITTYIEKENKTNLQANEYSVDYKNGIIYIGSGVSGIIEIKYFESFLSLGRVDLEDHSVPVPKNAQFFEYSSTINGLDSRGLFGYQKYNNSSTIVNLIYDVIKLPSFITLHKGSILLNNIRGFRKEVDYIDGRTELYTEESKVKFYDYVSTRSNCHVYRLRENFSVTEVQDLKEMQFNNEFMLEELEYSSVSGLAYNEGEWRFTGPLDYSQIHLKNPGFPSIPSQVLTGTAIFDKGKDKFSVDYRTNTIYTRNLSSFAASNASISFKYSCIDLQVFTIAKEIGNKDFLLPNEYIAYAYNKDEIEKLLPYYTPVIQSINIGTIG